MAEVNVTVKDPDSGKIVFETVEIPDGHIVTEVYLNEEHTAVERLETEPMEGGE